ncbi:MAG: glycosyltransferase family 2 protein [Actinobacteria bacterium]|nr:MAG: glycosyltransferase family 2 protein [Actinomycetota bacterium]
MIGGAVRAETNRPGVAVVVPCFNDGPTLTEAVRSAQEQERLGELVVVDDGSTDAPTKRIFTELEHEGVRVVHRDNGGLGAARMTGVRACQADYVFPLDADDRLAPGALARLAGALDGDPSLAVVWGDYQVFGERSYRQQTADTLDPWQITHQNDLPASMLIRRSTLLEAGGWELGGGYEDWDLWMSLAERGQRGRRIPIVAYEYRAHGVRMLEEAATRHEQLYELLRRRHPELFARRRTAWRRSPAPPPLKLALPIISKLPIGLRRRRLLAGAANHLVRRRPVPLLIRRAASQR